jgi:hypothetical protein
MIHCFNFSQCRIVGKFSDFSFRLKGTEQGSHGFLFVTGHFIIFPGWHWPVVVTVWLPAMVRYVLVSIAWAWSAGRVIGVRGFLGPHSIGYEWVAWTFRDSWSHSCQLRRQ